MTPHRTYIERRDGQWLVASLRAQQPAEVRAMTDDDLPAALAELGCAGKPACLGLPARMCLPGRIRTGDLPRRDRRRAMLYRLEEQLPLDAESLAADFLPAAAHETLAVAAPADEVGELVERLQAAGALVESICPAALLCAWDMARLAELRDGFVLIADGDGQLQLVRLAAGAATAWYVASAATAGTLLRADLLREAAAEDRPPALCVGDLPPDLVAELQGVLELQPALPPPPGPAAPDAAFLHAARSAACRLARRDAGWVDLRTGPLAPVNPGLRMRRWLTAAAVLAALLPAMLAAGAWWRAGQYQQIARQARDRQAAEFGRLHPARRLPMAIPRQLAAEAQRLSAVSGSGELPPRRSALDTLQRLAAALPPNVRLRLLEMRIEESSVFIDGQARQHADAEVVAAALRAAGFSVEPPRSERLPERGVSFLLSASPPPAADRDAPPAAAGPDAAPPTAAIDEGSAAPTARAPTGGRP